jgi:RNA polymerase sigma-70 factor (ECF subfamily)
VGTGLEEVYAGQYRRLVALVTAVAGSRVEAEEAVQEAFVRALGLTGRRAVMLDPEAWLYRVAVNQVRSRWRRARIGRRVASRLGPPEEAAPSLQASTDARLLLLAALRKVPFEQREALALHYLADLPLADIAARVGAPLGTVKARLSRGRNALARLLADDRPAGDMPGPDTPGCGRARRDTVAGGGQNA